MEKYGFVYIWRDKKHNRYYIGSHWGSIDDGYICSSTWMKNSYKRRPHDFKRRILVTNIKSKKQNIEEEHIWLKKIKPEKLGDRYYNLINSAKSPWWSDDLQCIEIGKKISAKKINKTHTLEHHKKITESKIKNGILFHTEETKRKMSKSHLGHTGYWKDKKLSDDHKTNISKKMSEVQRGASNSQAKKAKLICPNGNEYIVHGNIIDFCENYNLQSGIIYSMISRGGGLVPTPSNLSLSKSKDKQKRKNTSGWTVEVIN